LLQATSSFLDRDTISETSQAAVNPTSRLPAAQPQHARYLSLSLDDKYTDKMSGSGYDAVVDVDDDVRLPALMPGFLY
jgi:hypothetical protein